MSNSQKVWRPLRVIIALKEKTFGVLLVRTRATPNGHYKRDPNGKSDNDNDMRLMSNSGVHQ